MYNEVQCIDRIETGRLMLRHFELSDVESMFYNWASDPEVVRFMPYDLCHTIEDAQKRVDQWMRYYAEAAHDSWELFAIVLKSTGEVIGTIDYAETDSQARSAEVGYQLGKAWWGYGYAAEALRGLLKHCFEKVKLNRIWADYDTRNPNSGKVMQKVGMIYEETSYESEINSSEPIGRSQYAIHADEYFRITK